MGTMERERNEAGFSLIELMVVVLIIGILVSIVLPTYLGARQRAEDSAAKASARQGLTTGRSIFSSDGTYFAANVTTLSNFDTSVTWVDDMTPSTKPTIVSFQVTPAGVFVLAVYSQSGNCFFLQDEPPTSTTYAVLPGAPADCYADNAGAAVFGASW
jgi:type IV pilus assembly protein PilA